MGARPLRRKIQRLVEDRLAEEFLNEAFHEGDTVRIAFKNNALTFITAPVADETT
jgi:ATP-dependent Clp protease ATP-binding subunit ClpC